jgi:hypothetical protein
MPERHVITVHADGAAEFTRNPKLMDVFGHNGSMERVTEICKVKDKPLYYIKWCIGPYADQMHTEDTHKAVYGEYRDKRNRSPLKSTHLICFDSYEAAVAYEVETLNRMREQGISFAWY